MTRIYSLEELARINAKNSAKFNELYLDINGHYWRGRQGGNLEFLSTAKNVSFDNSISKLKSNNVQDAIDEVYKIKTQVIIEKISTITNITEAVKQVEIDFGNALYQNSKRFTFSDTKAVIGKPIVVSYSYDKPTGKDDDEVEMDDLIIRGKCNNGTIDLFVTSLYGTVYGKFKINYFLAS